MILSYTSLRFNQPRPPLEESIRTVNPPQLNPAKPPKRMFEPEPTDEQPYRPLNMLDHNQANNPKRRKTNENDEEEPIARQPMAPPVRQSSNRKVRDAQMSSP